MRTVRVPDRILVVDNDLAVRAAVEAHLTHRGYEVLTAASGDEALGMLARQKISCMLADSRLFGTKIGELLSRSLERDPNLAIVVLSAEPDVSEAVHFLQYGAMDYLSQPPDLTQLEAALQRGLRRRLLPHDDRVRLPGHARVQLRSERQLPCAGALLLRAKRLPRP